MNDRSYLLAAIAVMVCLTTFIRYSPNQAEAAEIRLVETNPAFGEEYDLLNVGTVSSGAFTTASLFTNKYKPNTKLKDSPYFVGGLSGDGGITFESLHTRIAWGGLRTGRVISIKGQIEKGDLDKLKELVKTSSFSRCISPGYCPHNNIIMLDSPGGQLLEALAIGRYIASENFITFLPKNAVCESACSLMFLAGYTRYEGYFFPRRFAHETSQLGIHQPFFRLPEGNYDINQVDQVVRALNQSVIEITDFFLNSGISIGFLQNMYRTAPEKMYYLSVAEQAAEKIFVVGRKRHLTTLSRPQMLSYCANTYKGIHKNISPDLLSNFQSNERTFLTFVVGQNFVCIGFKDKSDSVDEWKAYVCDGKNDCLLEKFGQVQLYSLQQEGKLKQFGKNDMEDLDSIATDFDNTEVGLALKEENHRVVLLHYMRLFAKKHWNDGTFKSIPASLAFDNVPQEFCGKVDEYDAGLVRKVQASLNKKGFDVGKPDGSLGPNTRKFIKRSNKELLHRTDHRIDVKLLQALGLSKEEYREYILCQ